MGPRSLRAESARAPASAGRRRLHRRRALCSSRIHARAQRQRAPAAALRSPPVRRHLARRPADNRRLCVRDSHQPHSERDRCRQGTPCGVAHRSSDLLPPPIRVDAACHPPCPRDRSRAVDIDAHHPRPPPAARGARGPRSAAVRLRASGRDHFNPRGCTIRVQGHRSAGEPA